MSGGGDFVYYGKRILLNTGEEGKYLYCTPNLFSKNLVYALEIDGKLLHRREDDFEFKNKELNESWKKENNY